MNPQKNYIDARGNYHNVENLTLTQIHDRASEEGYRLGKAEAQQKTDGDTISRQALKEVFLQDRCGDNFLPKHYVISTIDSAPTVELERVKNELNNELNELKPEKPQGEWLLLRTNYEDSGNNFYKCSICHYSDIHAGSAEVPFCWHCGASMKTKKDGQADE